MTKQTTAGAITGTIHRWTTRHRWLLAITAIWTWLLLIPPTSALQMTAGLVLVVIAHRLLAPQHIRRRRRTTLRARFVVSMVAGILYIVAFPQMAMADVPQGDACRAAPTPETTGAGVTGILDPQNNLPLDGTVYGDRGYAGMFWYAYDPGCAATVGHAVLGDVGGTIGAAAANGPDGKNASADTMLGNLLLKGAKLELAFVTGMRARALNPDYFDGFDGIIAGGVNALNDLLITPWIGLPLLCTGLIMLMLARRGNTSDTAHRGLVALAGLGIIAFLGNYPLQFSQWADSTIVGFQTGSDQGFLGKLPTSITPLRYHCDYDMGAFELPPKWTNGAQVIPGVACTVTYQPTLNPTDHWTTGADGVVRNYEPDYFASGDYFPEVMVANLIFPYWQEGIIGTNDRSGPNYDLALTFLRGQSLTTYDQKADEYFLYSAKNAPPDAVWCTYQNNARVCGRQEGGFTPDKIMSATEATYRDAIEKAGDSRYPYIAGKAGNRVAAAGTALAAVTSAAPTQGAAYTGVFAGRLLLRIFTFAGLLAGFALVMFPKLLRRIINTVGSALCTVVMLSLLGSLMTYLTLQLTANPKVFGAITPTGGLVILAVISVLLWCTVRPMRRITAMVSTAVTGDAQTLTNFRRTATGKARRLLRRKSRTPAGSHDVDPHQDSTGTGDRGQEKRPRPESRVARSAAAGALERYSAKLSAQDQERVRARKEAEFQAAEGWERFRAEHRMSRQASSQPTRDTSRDSTEPIAAPAPSTPSSRPEAATGNPRERDHSPERTMPGRLRRRSPGTPDRTRPDTAPTSRPYNSGPRVAPRSATGAYDISSLRRPDVFRPTAGTTAAAPAAPARNPSRSELQKLIWRPRPRPALPPAPPHNAAETPTRRPEFAATVPDQTR